MVTLTAVFVDHHEQALKREEMQVSSEVRIRSLEQIGEREIQGLSDVLIDCVEGGASVGFMRPDEHPEKVFNALFISQRQCAVTNGPGQAGRASPAAVSLSVNTKSSCGAFSPTKSS